MNLVPPPNSPTSSQFISLISVKSLLITPIGQSPTPKLKITYPKSYFLNSVKINVECNLLDLHLFEMQILQFFYGQIMPLSKDYHKQNDLFVWMFLMFYLFMFFNNIVKYLQSFLCEI